MKVALLTYHFVYNHGANLQALATTRALQARGCEVEVIDWRPQDLEDDFRRKVPKEQVALHDEFVSSQLPLSPLFRTANEIRDYLVRPTHRPDLILVGSDTGLSVFSPPRARLSNYIYGNPFWLNWVDDTPELRGIPTAYLSVSNTGSWYFLLEVATQRRMLQSLKQRQIITVRDKWTRWMIRSLSPMDKDLRVEDNFDPVFSLNRHVDFSRVDTASLGLPAKYILFNVPSRRCSSRWVREFQALAATDGCELIGFPNPQRNPLAGDLRILHPLAPLVWYKVIQGSSGYVGMRFHPIIVALANQIPFVAMDTYGHPSLALLGWNAPSKTFDVCRKAGRTGQVIKGGLFPLYSPRNIYRKLMRQDADTRPFLAEAQRVFDGNLNRMCALAQISGAAGTSAGPCA